MHANWDNISHAPRQPRIGAVRRDTILTVVPHPCRFGAGYNQMSGTTGRLAPRFSMRLNCDETIPNRGHTRLRKRSRRLRPETIYKILDEGYVCHIGFAVDSQPYVIPTLFARVGDAIYFHGSAGERMLRNVSEEFPCASR